MERRRLERAFPMPEEAVAFAAESVAGLRRLVEGSNTGRLAGLGVAMPYNLGSWQRELDIPLAAYQRWNEYDLRGALEAADRPRRVLRERRHGGRGRRAVPGPRPLARRVPLCVHRRGRRRRRRPRRRLSPRRQRQCRRPRPDADRPLAPGTAPRPDDRPEIAADPGVGQRPDPPPARLGQCRSRPARSWTSLLEHGHPAVDEWLDDAADALVLPDPVRGPRARRGGWSSSTAPCRGRCWIG